MSVYEPLLLFPPVVLLPLPVVALLMKMLLCMRIGGGVDARHAIVGRSHRGKPKTTPRIIERVRISLQVFIVKASLAEYEDWSLGGVAWAI
jgi:hypothetical protein